MTPTPKDPADALMALKPCPFCGGPVQLEESHRSRDRILGERRWWGVVCRNTTNLGGTCCMEQVPSASKEAAITRWNRRAVEASARALAAVPAAEVQESVRWKQLVHMVERGVVPEILVDWINHPDRLDYAAKLRAEHG